MQHNRPQKDRPGLSRPGQTAIEYMLLLSAVVVVVLVGMNTILPRTVEYSNEYYQRVSYGIMGEPTSDQSTGNWQSYKARSDRLNYP